MQPKVKVKADCLAGPRLRRVMRQIVLDNTGFDCQNHQVKGQQFMKASRACDVMLRMVLIFLPIVLTGLPIASAQQQGKLAPGRSLSISAKNVGSGGSTSYNWATSWGSYDRDYFTRQDVELEAHNLSTLPGKIVVDFYFIGQPEHQAEPRKLFSKRTFDVDVPPGYLKRVSVRSDVLKSNETRYAALGEQYNSGYQITGWLLQASVPGEATPFATRPNAALGFNNAPSSYSRQFDGYADGRCRS